MQAKVTAESCRPGDRLSQGRQRLKAGGECKVSEGTPRRRRAELQYCGTDIDLPSKAGMSGLRQPAGRAT